MAEHNQPIDRSRAAAEAALDERFAHLDETYGLKLRRFFVRQGFSEEESRDLTQDTFLRVFQNIESLRDAKAEKRWVFTVATNIWRNEVRSRQTGKRRATLVPIEGASAEGRDLEIPAQRAGSRPPEPLADALAAERRRLLREGLGALPPRMRRCALLRLGNDLSYDEIATLLQISPATVKVQLHQARRRLKEMLGDHFHDLEL